MKSLILPGLAAACAATTLVAQQLKPAWEYLVNQPGSPLPILTNALNGWTADNESGDGKSVMDSLNALQRYDANRLVLGIRENGIDESTATPEQLALAALYPDRSLIWINPTNGVPMGLALNIGLYPVPLDADFVAAGGVKDQYWWTFAVADDGRVYTGYKNKILRYNPDGQGGINPTPQVVFTLTLADLAAHGVADSTWAGWRWARLRVTGTGANTKILAGASASNRGNFLLTTTDGNSFTAGSWLGVGGGTSTPIPSSDPATPDDVWVYAGIYPGNSNGADSSYSRYSAPAPYTDNFTRNSDYRAPADPFTYPVKYRADFIGDVDANKDLAYLVSYSTPSWNSRAVVGVPRPGWLALSDQDGRFLSSYELKVTEDAELLPDDQASNFQGTVGFVSLKKLADGTVEVLWSGTIYGYGRFLVAPYGPEPVVPETGKPPGPFPANTVSAANWIATGGTSFDSTVTIGQEGQGPAPWSISRYNRGDFAVRLSPLDPAAAQDNFDTAGEYTGNAEGDLAPEQAWRPSADVGIIIPTARVNGPVDWTDGLGGFYPVVAASIGGSSGYGYSMVNGTYGTGDCDVQTGKAGDQSANPSPEGNFNFATTWFPYNQGWIGAAVNNPDAEGNPRWAGPDTHSPGLETNVVTWPSNGGTYGGTAVLSLPGVNALTDGLLFTTSTEGGSAVKIMASAPKADGSGWVISVRAASEADPQVLATTQSQFQFVYLPYSAEHLIGGRIAADGSKLQSSGDFTVARTAAGTYTLTIPGRTGTNGVLLLQNASFLPGSTTVADNNFLSYQYRDDGSGTNGVFVIQSRHTAAGGAFPLTDASFYVAWVDFSTPPKPAASQPAEPPTLAVKLSNGAATITWSGDAAGYNLQMATSLAGAATSWTTLGVVGQGNLATSYTVPATPAIQFFRLAR